MSGKRVRFDEDARQSLWRGVDQLASAVRITLGPRGRSVVFDRRHGGPSITRDGIAVAQEITLADPFDNLGVQMLRDGAFRTALDAGDGTTTATVLAHRLVREGLRAVAAGHHPAAIKRGIDRAVVAVLARLAQGARPVESARDLERVAIVAAGDRPLGELLAHALERVGRGGVVTIEDGRTMDTTLDIVEGTRFDGGYASPYFITDADDMEAALDHPVVMLVDGALEQAAEVSAALEHAARMSRPLLVIAGSVGGEALATLVVNRLRGTAPSIAISLGGSAATRAELLDDLAILTGASRVAPELGRSPERFEAGWFGRARHVTVTSEHTTLLQGGGRNAEVAARLAGLEHALGTAKQESARAALRGRIEMLSGGIALIRVGAPSDFERHARRAQLEDALAATRAAMEEGIVPGGGIALLRAGSVVGGLQGSAAERAGFEAVIAALAEPARTIGGNAGEDGDALVARLRGGTGAFGFNARSCTWGDLAAQGILDAVKVARCALQNAASVSGLVLTTDALVVDDTPGDEGGKAA